MTTNDVYQLLLTGVNLMILGMVVVFLLLGLLVFAVGGMSRVAKALDRGPQPMPPTESESTDAKRIPQASELLAVISAAIHQYRRSHPR